MREFTALTPRFVNEVNLKVRISRERRCFPPFLAHLLWYGVCNTMFARCMLRMLRCQGPLRHVGQGRALLRGSPAPQRPGSGNALDAEVEQNEEISTIAPLPLGNCHCPLCPQCNSGVQQSMGGVQQQASDRVLLYK